MPIYRLRSHTVDAYQFAYRRFAQDVAADRLPAWITELVEIGMLLAQGRGLLLTQNRGQRDVIEGQWLVRSPSGFVSVYYPAEFHKLYEAVEAVEAVPSQENPA